MEEVVEAREFARKNADGQAADRRLANRRLRHLTAAGLSKYVASGRS